MTAPLNETKFLETCEISPPPGAVASSCLPATFFDLIFFPFPPIQRAFFYHYPHSTPHFLAADVPRLKASLSLALARFHPLAGRITHPSGDSSPEIRYSDGDAVAFVVAVSGDDFFDISQDHARHMSRLRCLVPDLPTNAVLAAQVTVFPDAGIVVGVTIHHGVADGSTFIHFMKTWSSIHRFGATGEQLPYCERCHMLPDKSKKLEAIYLQDIEAMREDRSIHSRDISTHADLMLATFVFSRSSLEKLASKTTAKCSPYALACGYVWSCLVRSRADRVARQMEYFGFVTGCRGRLSPPLPSTYFGNCLGICCVELKKENLIGENSGATAAAAAAEAIWEVISGLERGVFAGVENWIKDVKRCMEGGAVTVAGSPKLGVYEVDFGFGRARKVEIVSVEKTGAMGLAESREEKGGIEIGLALPAKEMDEFVRCFYSGLKGLQ